MPRSIASPTTATACSQRTKLDRGPTCPPHSRPSSTNRRAAVAEVLVEQARRGDVQVGGDPLALQPGGLVGAAAGDQGERRPDLRTTASCSARSSGGHEAEDAHAPGPSRELPGGVSQAALGLRLRASSARARNGKPPPSRDRLGEPGDVADARHRALEDRVARAVGDGQRRAFRQRPGRPRGRDSLGDRSLDGLDDPADRHELAGQPLRERGVLTDRQALPIPPADVVANGRFPGRASLLGGLPQPRQRRRAGQREDPNSRRRRGRDDRGLAAVPAGDPLAPFRPKRRFAGQEQRTVEHDAGRARRHAPGRDVRARSRLGPRPARSPSASAACKSTNEDSAPPHPPASWPETISPSTPAAIARRISARDVTSPSTSRPDLVDRPYGRLEARLITGPQRDTNDLESRRSRRQATMTRAISRSLDANSKRRRRSAGEICRKASPISTVVI